MKPDEQEQEPATSSEEQNVVPKQPWVAPELISVFTQATLSIGLGNNDGAASHS